MKIKLVIYTSSTSKYDITGLTESVEWSGDVDTFPRKISVNLRNVNDIKRGNNLINYKEGNLVIFYVDGDEVFRGFIFAKSMSDQGNESFTAYDELIYVTKNQDSLLVKNKTASSVIESEFRKFGIAIGSIESTGHKIKKLVFQAKDLSEIIKDMLKETKKNNGKRFVLISKKGKTYLQSRQYAPELKITIDNVMSASKDTSIEDLRTQVMITKGALDPGKGDKNKKYTTYTAKDKSGISKYGIMQHVEEAGDKDTYAQMKKKAAKLLESLNNVEETISIEFMGNVKCITGYRLTIHDNFTDLAGKFFISSDSHKFEGGTHKMTLQLSRRTV